jgi:hypothetical protein
MQKTPAVEVKGIAPFFGPLLPLGNSLSPDRVVALAGFGLAALRIAFFEVVGRNEGGCLLEGGAWQP